MNTALERARRAAQRDATLSSAGADSDGAPHDGEEVTEVAPKWKGGFAKRTEDALRDAEARAGEPQSVEGAQRGARADDSSQVHRTGEDDAWGEAPPLGPRAGQASVPRATGKTTQSEALRLHNERLRAAREASAPQKSISPRPAQLGVAEQQQPAVQKPSVPHVQVSRPSPGSKPGLKGYAKSPDSPPKFDRGVTVANA